MTCGCQTDRGAVVPGRADRCLVVRGLELFAKPPRVPDDVLVVLVREELAVVQLASHLDQFAAESVPPGFVPGVMIACGRGLRRARTPHTPVGPVQTARQPAGDGRDRRAQWPRHPILPTSTSHVTDRPHHRPDMEARGQDPFSPGAPALRAHICAKCFEGAELVASLESLGSRCWPKRSRTTRELAEANRGNVVNRPRAE
jgi:hypothetical protein